MFILLNAAPQISQNREAGKIFALLSWYTVLSYSEDPSCHANPIVNPIVNPIGNHRIAQNTNVQSLRGYHTVSHVLVKFLGSSDEASSKAGNPNAISFREVSSMVIKLLHRNSGRV